MKNDDTIDRWLFGLHAETAADLDALLDVEAGIRDISVKAHHSWVRGDLGLVLDVDAGLHAVVDDVGELPSVGARSSVSGPHNQGATFEGPASAPGAVEKLLKSADLPTRLTLRNHGSLAALAGVLALIVVRSCAHTLTAGLSSGDTPQQVFTQAQDRIRSLSEHSSLDRALDRALNEVRDPDFADGLDRVRTLAGSLDNALQGSGAPSDAHGLADALSRSLDALLDQARSLVRTRSGELGTLLNVNLARGVLKALEIDLRVEASSSNAEAALSLASKLDRVRHDFTTVDFRGTDLTRYSLEGILWSNATTWPSNEWKAQALSDSTQLAPGLYEISAGTANVPDGVCR